MKLRNWRFLATTGWNVISLIVTQIISLVSFGYLSRRLSVREYGELATIQSLISVVWPILSMGLVSGVVTSQVKDSKSQAELRLSITTLAWVTFAISALMLLMPFTRYTVPFLNIPIIFLCVVVIAGLGTTINGTITAIYRSKHRAKIAAIVEISLAIMVLAFTFIFFDLFNHKTVMARMIAVIVGFFPSATILFMITRKSIWHAFKQIHLLGGYLIIGWPLVLHSLSGWLTGSMDRLVLNKFHGPEITGQYAVSAQIGGLFGIGALLIGQIWNPLAFELLQKGDKHELGRLVRFGGAIAVALPFAALAFGSLIPFFFRYILAKDYPINPPIVMATAIRGAFDGWYYLVSSPLFFYERNKQLTAITIGSGVLAGIFLWCFGQNISGLGIAASLGATTLIQCILIIFVTWHYKLWGDARIPYRKD